MKEFLKKIAGLVTELNMTYGLRNLEVVESMEILYKREFELIKTKFPTDAITMDKPKNVFPVNKIKERIKELNKEDIVKILIDNSIKMDTTIEARHSGFGIESVYYFNVKRSYNEAAEEIIEKIYSDQDVPISKPLDDKIKKGKDFAGRDTYDIKSEKEKNQEYTVNRDRSIPLFPEVKIIIKSPRVTHLESYVRIFREGKYYLRLVTSLRVFVDEPHSPLLDHIKHCWGVYHLYDIGIGHSTKHFLDSNQELEPDRILNYSKE